MKAYVFPGQGSQKKGMGEALFDQFPSLVQQADDILGYSIKDLCLLDTQQQLSLTQFTQPALFVVSALSYLQKLEQGEPQPDYVAGHSLGEYTALFASGVMDFATALQLVKKRGQLMGQASGGGMAAVVGLQADAVQKVVADSGIDGVDVANFNCPSQTVISGMQSSVSQLQEAVKSAGGRFMMLNVSAAFHSRYMAPAKQEFAGFLQGYDFSEPRIPVIANINARPYQYADIKQNLIEQITGSVCWTDTIRYLLGRAALQQLDIEIEEVGPGRVLSNLTVKIQRESDPILAVDVQPVQAPVKTAPQPVSSKSTPDIAAMTPVTDREVAVPATSEPVVTSSQQGLSLSLDKLGDRDFCRDYNLRYPYMAGAMYRGIASKELVVALGKAGMLGCLGSGGLSLSQLETDIRFIQQQLPAGPYAVNLLNMLNKSELEEAVVDLFLSLNVGVIEAAAYMQNLSLALVRYRLRGLSLGADGQVLCANKVIAKVSRPEVAEAFLSPAPESMVSNLLAQGKITAEQAQWAKRVPMADDLVVESDSGGHTDQGISSAVLPAMMMLRDQKMQQYGYSQRIRVGAAGGIGTPHAAAAALIMGADFLVTGSINQCTVEANTSDVVKDMLQQMNVQDTDYAPAGDMFEIGARVQVLKRGLFFPTRANKLYDTYLRYDSIDDIDSKTRQQIEQKYFKRSFDDVFAEMSARLAKRNPAELEKLHNNPKHKMALIFRWYFHHSTQLALQGETQKRVDFQIHTGPALGAFNQWVRGTELEDWRHRHVDVIGQKLMQETAQLLNNRVSSWMAL